MNKRLIISAFAAILTFFAGLMHAGEANETPGRFEAGDGTFLLNGRPFVVKAAELHYPRIPKPYWDNRIKQCKALGMNTVCLYVFWNSHESEPDKFDFTGQNDLREFIKLCDANGMKVILRPGPYVCAEWEMGGLPWWLLQKKDIRLRESDPYFLERVDKFQKAVAEQVGDLTVDKGGPIIMIQVENEYGSYGIDKPYVATIRDMLRKNFGKNVTLFQCDWSSNFQNNGLDDLIWTMNFGTGSDIDREFEPLKKVRPNSPLMCSEFWSGWFDKWGANHETRPADDMVAGIDEMLSKGISFSLYMTHGGTNWGHWAGANSPGFAPDVTSYDYDAPISESGQYTPKYWKLRETMAKYSDKKLPTPPAVIKSGKVKKFKVSEAAPLFTNIPQAKNDSILKTMEEYGQGFGSILYRTELPALPAGSTLTINDAHDYAQVFVNGKYVGTLDRRNGEKELKLPACGEGDSLDILVEAMGRINFGRAIKDFKGITDRVSVTEHRNGRDFVCDLKDWKVYNLPDKLDFYESMTFVPAATVKATDADRYPRGTYRGTFNVSKPQDTFLDMSAWGKGLVYVNGHALGRFWEIGPQQTLYMPGCWLKKGKNEIVIFDVVGPRDLVVEGLDAPLLDELNLPRADRATVDAKVLENAGVAYTGTLKNQHSWQKTLFGTNLKGRYLCIEAVDAYENSPAVSIAEVYLLDKDGKRIARENWAVDAVNGEVLEGNHTADKAFDLQESTYWKSPFVAGTPNAMVIDLGAVKEISGIELLPRIDNKANEIIKNFRIYVKNTSFAK